MKDRIEWAQSFAIFQYNSLKPLHYFQSEAKFENTIKKLKVGEFDSIFLSKPNIIYEADIKLGPKDIVERMRKPESEKSICRKCQSGQWTDLQNAHRGSEPAQDGCAHGQWHRFQIR